MILRVTPSETASFIRALAGGLECSNMPTARMEDVAGHLVYAADYIRISLTILNDRIKQELGKDI